MFPRMLKLPEAATNRRESRLRVAAVATTLLLQAMAPFAEGAQAAGAAGTPGDKPPVALQTTSALPGLPAEPRPNSTIPLFMRPGNISYMRPRGYFPNPLAPYLPTTVEPPSFLNTARINDLVQDGKIHLGLGDAVILALQNNFDIAIQRYNLDIADTEILRAHSGASLLGVNAGLVTGTLGGAGTLLSAGGGPGGTSVSSGGAATGSSGLSLTTNGGGSAPEALDPVIAGTVQLQREYTPEPSPLFYGTNRLNQNINEYNFTYTQGFLSGTQAQFTWNNSYFTQNSPYQTYSPTTQSTFNLQLTQHLLRGFGPGVNGRFILQAKNNRRVTDSAFRQQVLYTINQVENIYWGLVSAYEDVQSKQRALNQSTQLLRDDQRQLQIGTLAPLDVVNAQSQTASDQQAVVSAMSTLEYQQLVMKQAISRNLEDPILTSAPIIPTDRVSLAEIPEEGMPVDDLVRRADANRPELEQAVLALKNDEITLKGEKNGLLPTLDGFAFYGGSAIGGTLNPSSCGTSFTGATNPCAGLAPSVGYGSVFQNTFNNSSPNKGAGLTLSIPLRNREAQSEQARSVIEYRQEQLRVQQLYVQIRMQVINQQYALTNDRAQVKSAEAAREYAFQSLDAEQRKLKLGASTTANVLQQERNLATAEDNLITARATYAKDRAQLDYVLADTLDKYGISLGDAVTGKVTQMPTVPGLIPAAQEKQPVAGLPVPGQPGGSPNDGLDQNGMPQTPQR